MVNWCKSFPHYNHDKRRFWAWKLDDAIAAFAVAAELLLRDQVTTEVSAESKLCQIRSSDDYRSVNWNGTVFEFTASQAAIVRVLIGHHENGTPIVSGETLLDAADSSSNSVRQVCDKGKHPAWGTFIVESERQNNFKIISRPAENPT